jgi:hypothetical protein
MKRSLRKVCSSGVAVLLIVGLAAIPAHGGPEKKVNAATSISEFQCGISAQDSGVSMFLMTTETHAVMTKSGNTVLSCHFDVPDGASLPVHATVQTGFWCGTHKGMTKISRAVTTPSGQVHLKCQIKANK